MLFKIVLTINKKEEINIDFIKLISDIYTYNDRRVYLCYFCDPKYGIAKLFSPPSQPN